DDKARPVPDLRPEQGHNPCPASGDARHPEQAKADASDLGMKFKISEKLSLPEDAARWTFADLAIKGAGKTYAASVMAEEFLKAGVPIIAIDPMGIWWGLRNGIDGH